MRAKDITRPIGSEYDTGRASLPSFQDMNFGSIKNDFEPNSPRAVVWQYTDPYQPPTEPDPNPMLPQTLLMAYEEHGRVLPVVSDFDCFLLGTRGVRFRNPLPDEQVELVQEMVDDIEMLLKDNSEGKCSNWTTSWLDNMERKTGAHAPMPKYGFGDPKSYAIMKHAGKRSESVMLNGLCSCSHNNHMQCTDLKSSEPFVMGLSVLITTSRRILMRSFWSLAVTWTLSINTCR